MATMDVYGFSLSRDQETAAAIWVGNQPSQDFILVGWHVKPSLYGDSRTRFFTYWTKDGFLTTGCYNTACPGFQLQADARVFPGDVIDPVSETNGRRQNITIKVYKEDQTGDWWVHYGFNSNPTAVGKFPKSLFTGLADSTADFAFGGYTYNAITQLTPPMGSGSSQTGSAASFSDLQYIEQDGTVSAVAGNLPSHVDNRSCYSVTPIVNGKFFYGGPGGC
ncbi:unnamed protein product [Urochloa decumbens]|uniref:Neprosin PEP catalytic domain-containing protein n=1 Tax=Urochloa decumbens TaxID=240449 RepID=A0ABC9E7A4_9POAL